MLARSPGKHRPCVIGPVATEQSITPVPGRQRPVASSDTCVRVPTHIKHQCQADNGPWPPQTPVSECPLTSSTSLSHQCQANNGPWPPQTPVSECPLSLQPPPLGWQKLLMAVTRLSHLKSHLTNLGNHSSRDADWSIALIIS